MALRLRGRRAVQIWVVAPLQRAVIHQGVRGPRVVVGPLQLVSHDVNDP